MSRMNGRITITQCVCAWPPNDLIIHTLRVQGLTLQSAVNRDDERPVTSQYIADTLSNKGGDKSNFLIPKD